MQSGPGYTNALGVRDWSTLIVFQVDTRTKEEDSDESDVDDEEDDEEDEEEIAQPLTFVGQEGVFLFCRSLLRMSMKCWEEASYSDLGSSNPSSPLANGLAVDGANFLPRVFDAGDGSNKLIETADSSASPPPHPLHPPSYIPSYIDTPLSPVFIASDTQKICVKFISENLSTLLHLAEKNYKFFAGKSSEKNPLNKKHVQLLQDIISFVVRVALPFHADYGLCDAVVLQLRKSTEILSEIQLPGDLQTIQNLMDTLKIAFVKSSSKRKTLIKSASSGHLNSDEGNRNTLQDDVFAQEFEEENTNNSKNEKDDEDSLEEVEEHQVLQPQTQHNVSNNSLDYVLSVLLELHHKLKQLREQCNQEQVLTQQQIQRLQQQEAQLRLQMFMVPQSIQSSTSPTSPSPSPDPSPSPSASPQSQHQIQEQLNDIHMQIQQLQQQLQQQNHHQQFQQLEIFQSLNCTEANFIYGTAVPWLFPRLTKIFGNFTSVKNDAAGEDYVGTQLEQILNTANLIGQKLVHSKNFGQTIIFYQNFLRAIPQLFLSENFENSLKYLWLAERERWRELVNQLRDNRKIKTLITPLPAITKDDCMDWVWYKKVLEERRLKLDRARKGAKESTVEFVKKYSEDMVSFVKSLLQESELLLGPPPEPYAMISLGSLSSLDMLPYSDLECAMLLSSTSSSDWESSSPTDTAKYFSVLYQLFEFKIACVGERSGLRDGEREKIGTLGFCLDTEGHPRKELRLRNTPERMALSCCAPETPLDDAMSFSLINANFVYGDIGLYNIFREKMNEVLTRDVKGMTFRQKFAIAQIKHSLKEYSNICEVPIRKVGNFRVKYRFYAPLKYSILHLAMFLGYTTNSVPEALVALKSAGIFSDGLAEKLLRKFGDLLSQRLDIQFAKKEQNDYLCYEKNEGAKGLNIDEEVLRELEILEFTQITPLICHVLSILTNPKSLLYCKTTNNTRNTSSNTNPSGPAETAPENTTDAPKPAEITGNSVVTQIIFPTIPENITAHLLKEMLAVYNDKNQPTPPNAWIRLTLTCSICDHVSKHATPDLFRIAYKNLPEMIRRIYLEVLAEFVSPRPDNQDFVLAMLSDFPNSDGRRVSLDISRAQWEESLCSLLSPHSTPDTARLVIITPSSVYDSSQKAYAQKVWNSVQLSPSLVISLMSLSSSSLSPTLPPNVVSALAANSLIKKPSVINNWAGNSQSAKRALPPAKTISANSVPTTNVTPSKTSDSISIPVNSVPIAAPILSASMIPASLPVGSVLARANITDSLLVPTPPSSSSSTSSSASSSPIETPTPSSTTPPSAPSTPRPQASTPSTPATAPSTPSTPSTPSAPPTPSTPASPTSMVSPSSMGSAPSPVSLPAKRTKTVRQANTVGTTSSDYAIRRKVQYLSDPVLMAHFNSEGFLLGNNTTGRHSVRSIEHTQSIQQATAVNRSRAVTGPNFRPEGKAEPSLLAQSAKTLVNKFTNQAKSKGLPDPSSTSVSSSISVPSAFSPSSSTLRFHLKSWPELPMMEYSVSRLYELIVGPQCVPRAVLWSVEPVSVVNDSVQAPLPTGDKAYPLLVAETIDGITLREAIMHSAVTFEPKNYSQMVLMALLTNPEDGKSDNYMVQPHVSLAEGNSIVPTGIVSPQLLKLIAIDNDHAFVPSITRRGMVTIPFVKTILYCFDQMRTYVHEHVIDEFLQLNINSVISNWIIDVEDMDQKYRKLFSLKRLEELYRKAQQANTRECTCVPMSFHKSAISDLYEKMYKIQELFRRQKKFPIWSC